MRFLRLSLFVALGCLAFSGNATALTANPQCVRDAHGDYKLCAMACRENLQVDKDLCRNVDHDCAEACRAGRQACVDVPLGELQTCKAGCNSDLAAARQACKDNNPEGSPERDACIDAAQVVAFQCKDTCREGVRDELQLCRRSFRACMRACPPTPE